MSKKGEQKKNVPWLEMCLTRREPCVFGAKIVGGGLNKKKV
jgi:hypothetical protein